MEGELLLLRSEFCCQYVLNEPGSKEEEYDSRTSHNEEYQIDQCKNQSP
jgi:hypothetical protein